MSVLQKLTEGIVGRDLQKEGAALLDKWEQTGLLEGIEAGNTKQSMARLLENQAKELLREASTMAASDVEGFAAVAFPIVRRVFGSLIANDLVSVQPMSLPSGLIFFLDFNYSKDSAAPANRLGNVNEKSIYGGGTLASQLTAGVDLTAQEAERGFYSLNQGFSSPTGSKTEPATLVILSGTFGANNATLDKLCRWDPDFSSGTTTVSVLKVAKTELVGLNEDNLVAITVSGAYGLGFFSGTANPTSTPTIVTGSQVRRLSQYSGTATTDILLFNVSYNGTYSAVKLSESMGGVQVDKTKMGPITFPIKDELETGGAIGSVIGDNSAQAWGLEAEAQIPEIDIKVDSVAITAITKKLKAKWSPELGQDLNAYHNLDAEVELTSILSEQIALEIDREILEDLIKGATAGTYYWSRSPGMFLNRTTGNEIGASSKAPDFTGNVSEWYETLLETINDVSAQIHRRTLRGGANFMVCGPEVANILEFTAGFRASVTADVPTGTAGAHKVGQVSKKWDIYVDPYFPRNVILVGRKGGSFLESGYVYAPYVPLQVTPTIFGVDDFVPRKGVMTRYGKKMVRPDFYGLVIVRGLLGEAGA